MIPDLSAEFIFKTSRSSGKGGQNVNKVSTKVELRFNIDESVILSDLQKELLKDRLNSRLTILGELVLTSSAERSQLANKKKVIARALKIIEAALTPVKKRVATRQPKTAIEKRLSLKRQQSDRKSGRRKINPAD